MIHKQTKIRVSLNVKPLNNIINIIIGIQFFKFYAWASLCDHSKLNASTGGGKWNTNHIDHVE